VVVVPVDQKQKKEKITNAYLKIVNIANGRKYQFNHC
jgi:hypothetical protein